MNFLFSVLIVLLNILNVKSSNIKKISLEERSPSFWPQNAEKQIFAKLKEQPIKSIAKNIILAIGDGMGISTVTASRIYKNQQMINSKSPDVNLNFEDFPNIGLSKTFTADRYVADSAATATAILTGIKANNDVIGMSSGVRYKDCNSYRKEYELINIAEMFYRQGKAIGFVTTTSIVDATPAAMYAFTPARSWTHYTKKNCKVKDIALQFFEQSHKFNVVMGGGRKSFLSKTDKDPQYPNKMGSRNDDRNLILEWKNKMHSSGKTKAKYIWNSTDLKNVDTKSVEYLLGLFEYENMKYKDEQQGDLTLDHMTKIAIEILSKNSKGYFLLIEGGNIDKAHHTNRALRAILETLELEKAVKVAEQMSDPLNTLLIVTADHSHTLTISNYLNREADIAGINVGYRGGASDDKGFTSLLYSNGPGYQIPRENITSETIFTPDTVYNSGVPFDQATHGGEEVGVYAKGPWGHLLKDFYEQSYIGNVMMYASCNGIFKNRDGCDCCNSVSAKTMNPWILIVILNLLNI